MTICLLYPTNVPSSVVTPMMLNQSWRFHTLCFAILLSLAVRPSSAQTTTPDTKEAPSESTPKPLKLGGITLHGSFRTRFEDWRWFKGDRADNTYAFSGNILRLALSQSRVPFDWQLEFALPFLLGLPENAISPGIQGQLGMGATYYVANDFNRNSAMVFVKQAYLVFKKLGGNPASSLLIGRYEFMDGSEITPKNDTLATLKRDRINQRLIGNFGWSHVGRSFDGLHYIYNKPSGNLTLIAAFPTRGVFQTDGWGVTETAFSYGAYTKPWGAGKHSAETRILGIYYDDWRQILKTDSRPLPLRREDLAPIRIGSFGGHQLNAIETKVGTVDLLFWGVGQMGRWGQLDHRAYAVAIEGGVQPKFWWKLKPWIRGGFFDGSGDGNPNDSTHNTFFQILPTPRPFARFPFFNLMNSRDYMGILMLRPHKQVTLSSEFHALRLSNARDLWYLGGGVYQPWTFGYVGRAAGGAQSLADLYDLSVDYRISPHITLTGYYGYAQGRAVTSTIYPQGKNASLGYLELNYRF
ncbi:MAG: alginate export family protein [Terriglobia bacterium]